MAARILLTGAGGRIGSVLAKALAEEHQLRLLDVTVPEKPARSDRVEWVEADITDFERTVEAAKDIDCVIHLAATPNAKDWDTVSRLNIHGTRNVFEAARRNSVPKIVFASSTHVVGMCDLSDPLTDDNAFQRRQSLRNIQGFWRGLPEVPVYEARHDRYRSENRVVPGVPAGCEVALHLDQSPGPGTSRQGVHRNRRAGVSYRFRIFGQRAG